MSKTFRAWKIDEPLFLPPMVQRKDGGGDAKVISLMLREARTRRIGVL
jgi:hypothetical protein